MLTIAVPSNQNGGLQELIKERFGKCESLTLVSLEDKEIKAVKTIPIHVTERAGNLGIHVANVVKNNDSSISLVRYIGEKAFQSLKNQDIQILQIPDKNLTVRECVELHIQGKLKSLLEQNAHLIKI
ncbi:MAG: NifB/NifX family molybdenum-iron cluster-binding protein [Promethearchaeota archaeon]|jgi:predicted Fe-Mo cluster-binding NifX family protein